MTPETDPANHAELILRTSRRALMVVLAMVLLFGATVLAHEVHPGTLLADWPSKAPWLIPIATVFVVVLLNAPLRRHGLRADGPEVQAMIQDEFRQVNLARAQRVALFVLLIAQVPLALLYSGLTAEAAVLSMAVSSITLGTATLIASFLIFDRD